jgi:hypothetical protein
MNSPCKGNRGSNNAADTKNSEESPDIAVIEGILIPATTDANRRKHTGISLLPLVAVITFLARS